MAILPVVSDSSPRFIHHGLPSRHQCCPAHPPPPGALRVLHQLTSSARVSCEARTLLAVLGWDKK